jgi:prevent-host-death family protein
MERRISATELVRTLGDILNRVRYKGDAFVVERNGKPVARIVPLPGTPGASLRAALEAWRAAGGPDDAFADDLERRIPQSEEDDAGRPFAGERDYLAEVEVKGEQYAAFGSGLSKDFRVGELQ